jgi:hypothetical protein
MNHDNWYVYSMGEEYYYNVEKILEITKSLIGENQKILFGYEHYYLSEMPEERLTLYMDSLFSLLIKNQIIPVYATLPNILQITDRTELENRLRKVFLRKFGGYKVNVDFIREGKFDINRLLERFSYIDEETLYELKYTLAKNVHHTSDIVNTQFAEDKIRFRDMPAMSLAHHWKLNEAHQFCNSIYTWLEIDPQETLEPNALYKDYVSVSYNSYRNLHLIITDDLQDISNFTYYINTFWTSAFGLSIAVNDNKGTFTDNRFEKFDEEVFKDNEPIY